MSKIHTLKLALAYIDFLNDVLKSSDTTTPLTPSAQHPQPPNHRLAHCDPFRESIKSNNSHDIPQARGTTHCKSPDYNDAASPCSSTATHYGSTSAASVGASEEEDDYQHCAKRARFEFSGAPNSSLPPVTTSPTTNFSVPPCCMPETNYYEHQYITQCCKPEQAPRHQQMLKTPYNQATAYHQMQQQTPNQLAHNRCLTNQQTVIKDDQSKNLREAFRDYRSFKRKYHA